MSLYPKSANILIEQLAKLPGVGKATAQRLAFFILKSDQQDNINLAHACLLYTSPSPRDRTRSRMPSSA